MGHSSRLNRAVGIWSRIRRTLNRHLKPWMIGAAWAGLVVTFIGFGVISGVGPPGREVADGLRFIADFNSDEPNYGGLYAPSGVNGWHSKVTGRFVSIDVYEGFVVGEIESGPYVGAEPGYFVIDLEMRYCWKELSEAEYRGILQRKGLADLKPIRRIRF